MHKISFYVPESHLEKVKSALFDCGAGKVGEYDYCCWQTKGEGQYRALENSNPFLGEKNKISKIEEYCVEMIFEDHLMDIVINALLESHPYEVPVFSIWPVRIR